MRICATAPVGAENLECGIAGEEVLVLIVHSRRPLRDEIDVPALEPRMNVNDPHDPAWHCRAVYEVLGDAAIE